MAASLGLVTFDGILDGRQMRSVALFLICGHPAIRTGRSSKKNKKNIFSSRSATLAVVMRDDVHLWKPPIGRPVDVDSGGAESSGWRPHETSASNR